MAIMGIEGDKLGEVCRRNNVLRLLLFGSVARGDATHQSDIDLIAELPEDKSLLDVIRIQRELSDALGRRVDLLTERSISPYIRQQIGDALRVVYEAE